MKETGPKMRRDTMNSADGVPTVEICCVVIIVRMVSARSVSKEILEELKSLRLRIVINGVALFVIRSRFGDKEVCLYLYRSIILASVIACPVLVHNMAPVTVCLRSQHLSGSRTFQLNQSQTMKSC